MDEETKHEARGWRRQVHRAGWAALLILGCSLAVVAGWNMALPEILEVDAIRYKHAVGLVVLASVFGHLLSPRRRHWGKAGA
jgi:hypothetical protein